jgi:serine/threonine protein kinase
MNAQQASQMPFEPGAVIGGKYRLISLIGIGGVGRVYLARHIELDTEVAIKVLRTEMGDRPEAVQRFSREARASVRLRSERIARVLDVGTHEGKPYFVMEYMAGCNLLEMSQQANVDIATLCEFFIQACEGLADAHAQGVVHRDIKPENLFVVRDPSGWRSLKVFDFGISKFSLTGKYSDVDLASMRTEAMMGTPHYISPEQIRSTRDVDHRTDIWSLGAVMFEVLSGGKLPFREEREVTALVAEVLEMPHRSLLDIAPNVPERLAAIVDRCLEKDRELRYQTMAEVALELLPLAPARARSSAERAVSVMQAAGMMPLNGDMESLRPMNLALADRPLSAPPPSVAPALENIAQSPLSGLRPSESQRTPPAHSSSPAVLPSVPPVGAANTRPPMPSRTPTIPSARRPADSEHASAPLVMPVLLTNDLAQEEGKVRKRKAAWLILLVAACLLVGIVIALTQRQEPQVAVTAPKQLAPVPPSGPTLLVAPVPASAAEAASPPNAAGAEHKPAAPKPVWVARPTPALSPPKAGVAKSPESPSSSLSPASPPSTKLDLRRER